MALDLAVGKLQPQDVRNRVREYITAHFRMFSKFGPQSLDACAIVGGAGDRSASMFLARLRLQPQLDQPADRLGAIYFQTLTCDPLVN